MILGKSADRVLFSSMDSTTVPLLSAITSMLYSPVRARPGLNDLGRAACRYDRDYRFAADAGAVNLKIYLEGIYNRSAADIFYSSGKGHFLAGRQIVRWIPLNLTDDQDPAVGPGW